MKKLALFVGFPLVIFLGYAGLPMLFPPASVPRVAWEGPPLAEMTFEEVQIESGPVPLAALVFTPEKPRAVITIVHGSGGSYRDHGWYTRVTEHLNDRSIAVVIPDKRGSGSSSGDWRDASIEDLAQDAAAVHHYAAERWPDLPHGVLGTSQGGWVAAVLAAQTPQLDFAIAQSAATVPARDQLRFEEYNTLRAMGMPGPAAALVSPVSAWSIRAFRQKETWEAIGAFDALTYWRQTTQPVLVIYGSLDEQDNVPVARSVQRLTDLEQQNIRVEVLDGLGHSMNTPGSGTLSTEFLTLVSDLALAQTDRN